MNNLFFAAARYLRAAGVDAHLFLFNDAASHFHPSKDTFNSDFESYTTELPFGLWQTFATTPVDAIAKATRGFDFLIGTGAAPALVHRAGRKLDIYQPYGEDLVNFPFWLGFPRSRALLSAATLPRHQRAGIRESSVILGLPSPRDEALYAKLGRIQGKRVISQMPMLCNFEFSDEKLPTYFDRSVHYKRFKELRDSADLLVWNHSRICIEKTVNYKGTEKLIDGFAMFVAQNPGVRAKLAIFEYGPDQEAARAQIAARDLGAHVAWLPLMPRKEVLLGLSFADVAIGELGYSWLLGGAITECMAMGKPMIHYRNDADFSKEHLYPLLPASTPADVAAQLERWMTDRDAVIEAGRGAKRYIDDLADSSMDVVKALIEEKRRFGRVDASTIDPKLIIPIGAPGPIPSGGDALANSIDSAKARLRALLPWRRRRA